MRIPFTLSLALLLSTGAAVAKEYPIGEPQMCPGLEVGAVYLQPIEMAPPGMMRATADSDVHLEADIRATADQPALMISVLDFILQRDDWVLACAAAAGVRPEEIGAARARLGGRDQMHWT